MAADKDTSQGIVDLTDPVILTAWRRALDVPLSDSVRGTWLATAEAYIVCMFLRQVLNYNGTCLLIEAQTRPVCYRNWAWIPVPRRYKPPAPFPVGESHDIVTELQQLVRLPIFVKGAPEGFPLLYPHKPLSLAQADKMAWVELPVVEPELGRLLIAELRRFADIDRQAETGRFMINWTDGLHLALVGLEGDTRAIVSLLPPSVTTSNTNKGAR